MIRSAKIIVASKTVHHASHILIKKMHGTLMSTMVNGFLPQIRRWTKENVALLIDGFSGHDNTCSDPSGQVTVYKFPPNMTICVTRVSPAA